MVTVAVAVALLLLGVGMIFFQAQTIDLARELPLSRELIADIVSLLGEQTVAWAALAAAPLLLIVGSVLPNI